MSEIKPKTKSIKGCRTFDEILDVEYGTQGTPERDAFEQGAVAFILAERLKEESNTHSLYYIRESYKWH